MRSRVCFPRRVTQSEIWDLFHKLIASNHEERLREFEEYMAQTEEWRKLIPEAKGGRRLVVNIYTGEIVKEEE